ncbi:MAG: zinc ribbon domain-containing protein [Clostridia bacterium]|nr:zinc ribbon domain-containing protein [Clostridia bacterium]
MDFFKNLSTSLTKAAEATAKKAGELTDTAKLNLKKGRIKSDIEDMYTDIGRLIYKQYKESADESNAIAEKCLAIDKSMEELAAVMAEIEAIRTAAEAEKEQHTAAGSASAPTQDCAEEQTPSETPVIPALEETTEKADDTEARFCPACGAALPKDAAFCNKCGQKQD